jgi:hypothetical protein
MEGSMKREKISGSDIADKPAGSNVAPFNREP